eukprot:6858489-Prymnesium_polylepis.1
MHPGDRHSARWFDVRRPGRGGQRTAPYGVPVNLRTRLRSKTEKFRGEEKVLKNARYSAGQSVSR